MAKSERDIAREKFREHGLLLPDNTPLEKTIIPLGFGRKLRIMWKVSDTGPWEDLVVDKFVVQKMITWSKIHFLDDNQLLTLNQFCIGRLCFTLDLIET